MNSAFRPFRQFSWLLLHFYSKIESGKGPTTRITFLSSFCNCCAIFSSTSLNYKGPSLCIFEYSKLVLDPSGSTLVFLLRYPSAAAQQLSIQFSQESKIDCFSRKKSTRPQYLKIPFCYSSHWSKFKFLSITNWVWVFVIFCYFEVKIWIVCVKIQIVYFFSF